MFNYENTTKLNYVYFLIFEYLFKLNITNFIDNCILNSKVLFLFKNERLQRNIH